ncbi:hypothetical protein D9619_012196 [Psilocybe cf. subviscida]|uniref:Polysaccharide lyase 14 domain-containing protein n=1 Tax=Psilocybe cf. subviscida TaxID=2480587 RepID=A0A8H5B7M3_9AGAR|nr:hypothetical protein D9619_012196 [Psilocybe cf. subviscida]
MASVALLCAVLCSGVFKHFVLAAPSLGQDVALNILGDIESLLIGPATPAYTPPITQIANPPPYPYTFAYTTGSTVFTSHSIETVTVTEEQPVTITLTLKPTTVTEFITVTPSHTRLVSPISPSPTSPTNDDQASWQAPTPLRNFDSFNIVKYASGKGNTKIVSGIPAEASARPETTPNDRKSSPATKSHVPWDNSSSVLQIFYPEGSINPAQDPVGGADFYAAPIDLTDARNVSFTFSVFFPADFDWVLAGKLPGLYGGHDGCSGGNAALDCFSTRLMWREDGAGELYLYAPKAKQTKSLCEDPQSVCDATYGLSIGRGAFYWKAGGWTTVTQTIYLNTPGHQDGAFTLDVNGVRKISRTDVFYRDDLSDNSDNQDDNNKKQAKTTKTKRPGKTATTTKHSRPATTSTTDGDILGPILGGLLGGLRRQEILEADTVTTSCDLQRGENTIFPGSAASLGIPTGTPTPTPTPTPSATADADGIVTADGVKETEVKFIGIFFSTFFGGHEDKYATPRDQYTWFKDFGLVYNS